MADIVTPEGKLTDKQSRFVTEFLIDFDATKAAIRAGYALKRASEQGYQLLHKTTVQSAIRRKQRETEERLDITRDDIVKGLWTEATREGDGTSQAARVSAWMGVAKILGHVTDRREVTGRITHSTHIMARFENMSVEQLDAIANGTAFGEQNSNVIDGTAVSIADDYDGELALTEPSESA